MALETYNQKRDFTQTAEPPGEIHSSHVRSVEKPRFVVQEHHASHLHYDFRLEMDGVLKSWAVPKGPPADFKERRLAVQTEDHPLDYIDFNGTIPKGNYGAGDVSIWDSGWFEIFGEGDLAEAVLQGKIEVMLHGSRLAGKYDLVRTDDQKGQWLFIKSRGTTETHSRPVKSPDAEMTRPITVAGSVPQPRMPSPQEISPMLASRTLSEPFSDPAWQFEIKWDGYRAILFASDGKSELISRNKLPLDSSFPELAELSQWFACGSLIADGEIVALGLDGRPVFQALQNRYKGWGKPQSRARKKEVSEAAILFMAFDVLHCDGQDLTASPLVERRKLLASLIVEGGPVRFSDHVVGDGRALFEQLRSAGMEGVIAKRSESPYIQARSEAWAKIKIHQTMDAVICGFTQSPSAGRPFGALLLGAYQGDNLAFIGHVGTGFNQATMARIASQMEPLARKTSPFGTEISVNGKANWVKPEIVCEVKYAEITRDGQLRHPVFLNIRLDRLPEECVLSSEFFDREVLAPKIVGAAKTEGKTAAELEDASGTLGEMLSEGSTISGGTVRVSRHNVKLTNLGKQFWPTTGDTKRDLLRYYAAVAKVLLPHLTNRPLVVQRYPNGVTGQSFFQHNVDDHAPSFIRTYAVQEHDGTVCYAVCDNLAQLLYLINLGTIPLHVWNIRLDAPDYPDRIIFDLDPGTDLSAMITVAHAIREVLHGIGLEGYPKTSGASGLHICVPITPIYPSEQVVGFARLVGELTKQRVPDLVTLERRIKKRGESQVYLDCVQNGVGKTVVAPYSVRAEKTPTVSTPLKWDEVTQSLTPQSFTIHTILDRIPYMGDLHAPVLTKHQELGPAMAALADGAALPGAITKRRAVRRQL